MVVVHHIHKKLFAPTLGHEEAGIQIGLSQRVSGSENLALTCIGGARSTKSFEPQHGAPGDPR